ncbi:MAG: substrate-binding domain-containing protein [Bifidobacteriaceae bacterium]|nr:substrate-binding domain-containing protein [Bifidobacteriaceae bacterium]
MTHTPTQFTRRQVLVGSAAAAVGAVLVPALAACAAPDKKSTGVATPKSTEAVKSDLLADLSSLKGKSIGHFVIDASTPTAALSSAWGKQMAEEYEFSLEFFDGAADYNRVNSTLSTWASKGLDGVINTGVDPTPIQAGLDELKDAGIPVGGICAGYVPGTGMQWDVEINDWITFAKVLTYVLDRIGDSGGGVAYYNWPQVPALLIRDSQTRAMLDFYSIPILAEEIPVVPGQVQDIKQKTTSLLTRFPAGSDLKAIVAGWDEIGVAAAQAIEEAGRDDVFVVSSDGDLEALDMIRDGAPFVATGARSIYEMTEICYRQLATVVGGGDVVSTTIYVDAPLVTKDNVPPAGEYATGTGLLTFYVK